MGTFHINVEMSAIERSSEIDFQAHIEKTVLQGSFKSLCLLERNNPGVSAHDSSKIKGNLDRITEDRRGGAIVWACAKEFFWGGEQPSKCALATEKSYAI